MRAPAKPAKGPEASIRKLSPVSSASVLELFAGYPDGEATVWVEGDQSSLGWSNKA